MQTKSSKKGVTKAGKPRQRAPGAGAPARLSDPRRISFYIEAEDLAAINALEGSASEHYRDAIKAYLKAKQ